MTDPIQQYQTDHDLLVTLNERMSNLVDHVKGLTDANNKMSDEHEQRLGELEKAVASMEGSADTWRYIFGIAIGLTATAAGWLYVQDFTFQSSIDARIQKAITSSLVNYNLIRN